MTLVREMVPLGMVKGIVYVNFNVSGMKAVTTLYQEHYKTRYVYFLGGISFNLHMQYLFGVSVRNLQQNTRTITQTHSFTRVSTFPTFSSATNIPKLPQQ